MKRHLFLALALVTACGGNPSALNRNRSGSGSGTLSVAATVNLSGSSANAITSFEVDLQDGTGAAVSGATVTIHNADLGDVPLVEAQAGSGRYVNSKAATPSADFGLDISHPKGSVTGVVVGNPGMHSINAPASGATITAGSAVPTSWTTPSTAYSASVETRDFPQTLVPDTGAYTIAGGTQTNPPRTGQQLTVRRYNTVNLAGATVGSQMTVTAVASVTYNVQ